MKLSDEVQGFNDDFKQMSDNYQAAQNILLESVKSNSQPKLKKAIKALETCETELVTFLGKHCKTPIEYPGAYRGMLYEQLEHSLYFTLADAYKHLSKKN